MRLRHLQVNTDLRSNTRHRFTIYIRVFIDIVLISIHINISSQRKGGKILNANQLCLYIIQEREGGSSIDDLEQFNHIRGKYTRTISFIGMNIVRG